MVMTRIDNNRKLHALLIVAVILMSFAAPCTASQPTVQIVTASGEPIASVFELLQPSSFARFSKQERSIARQLELPQEDILAGPRLLRIQCPSCPSDTACSGHYELIVNSSGCVDPYGVCRLPLHTARTDT